MSFNNYICEIFLNLHSTKTVSELTFAKYVLLVYALKNIQSGLRLYILLIFHLYKLVYTVCITMISHFLQLIVQ
jgi:hypothetical protein